MQHSDGFVEEWRTIEGFENYEVSNLGRVRRVEYIKLCACLKGRRRMAGGFLWRYK